MSTDGHPLAGINAGKGAFLFPHQQPREKITMEREANAKNCQIMSEQEKRILRTLLPESEPLPYPTVPLAMSIGPDAIEYQIPDEDKEHLLRELFFFSEIPELDEEAFDIHEEKFFRIRDYKVIREDNRNYLVSPYYAKSGGTVLDWITGKNNEVSGTVLLSCVTGTGKPGAVAGTVVVTNEPETETKEAE